MKISQEALQLLEDSKKDINVKDILSFVEAAMAIKIAKLIKDNNKMIKIPSTTPEEISKQHELKIKNKALMEILDLLLEGD